MRKYNKQRFPFGAFAIILVLCILVSAASGAGGAFFMFSLLYSTPEETTAQEFVIEETTQAPAVSVTEAATEEKTEAASPAAADISAEEIEALIVERKEAKKAKNFARADEIRQYLLDKGVTLIDTREGTTYKIG